MFTTLLPPNEWAQMEFSSADLGDARRTRRLVEVAGAIAADPNGALPRALPDWADLKAAYRLFSNDEVTHERILQPHCERTLQSCAEPGEYLIVEDTTALDFTTHRSIEGLGPISNRRWSLGMLVHSTLALRVEAWDLEQAPEVTVMGLLDQHCWTRPPEPLNKIKSRRLILNRARESQRWARVLETLPTPEEAKWIFVADRESDIYEAFARCNEAGVDFIIRASHPRALLDEDQTVFTAVQEAPVLGTFEIDLRTRGEAIARTVKMEVRTTKVILRGSWRPGGKTPPFELNVVVAQEIGAPPKKGLRWVLLTSLPCESFAQVRRIVTRYTRRWVIEEYHKALKSGAQIEQSQLATAKRVQAVLAISAVVAIRLVNTKLLARRKTDCPVDPEQFGPEMIAILTARFGKPQGGWMYRGLLIAIARIGGFLARRHDGDPGWITIWRGWQDLQKMAEGVRILSKCG
jgi:hypothetical protein